MHWPLSSTEEREQRGRLDELGATHDQDTSEWDVASDAT